MDNQAETTVAEAVQKACSRIAPTWPLDQAVAINPWWHLIDQPFAESAAQLSARSEVRPLPSRAYLAECWADGRLQASHLAAASAAAGSNETQARLIASLQQEPSTAAMRLMPDVLDQGRNLDRQMAWRDEVVHQISQSCAAYFDQGQAIWHLDTSGSLYASWLRTVAHERGIGLIMGQPKMAARFKALPTDPQEILAAATTTLGVREADLPAYFHALLLSVNGWASWCAWKRWQARLQDGDDDVIVELLAIRVAWELVLYDNGRDPEVANGWRQAMAGWSQLPGNHQRDCETDWIWLAALEKAYQEDLLGKLKMAAGTESIRPRPTLQAAFCIDVRSEAWRRALETVGTGVETIGCAGFFGLPTAFRGLGETTDRPQLPGLLAPSVVITERLADDDQTAQETERLKGRLDLRKRWQQAQASGPASYAYVESFGLGYGIKFLMRAFKGGKTETSVTTPVLCNDAGEVSVADKAAMAGGMARILMQNGELAPLVLLVGHESESCNNPHASGLNCGACGGQSGEVNARMLSELLNDPAVREEMAKSGIKVPADTRFMAGVHNTTTDEVRLCSSANAPSEEALAKTVDWLKAAGELARAERAARVGDAVTSPATLLQKRKKTASDWGQVRPEWGLAGNAAFIIGPRWLTQDVNLGGRAFLHDYNWQKDTDFSILGQLFGGPLVVTHWINMQYYASTVDNLRYGSGNKVLHNVVGGNLGVFEGNGGDLRIGLSMQSLNDGQKWMHEPIRLSVVVAAPQEPIQDLIQANDNLRHLVDNDWLYLFQIDEQTGTTSRLKNSTWTQCQ